MVIAVKYRQHISIKKHQQCMMGQTGDSLNSTVRKYDSNCPENMTYDINLLNLSQTTNFIDSSKLRDFADDNSRFDENDRKFSKRVENTVGKGKIVCPTVFSKDFYCRHVNTKACLGKS